MRHLISVQVLLIIIKLDYKCSSVLISNEVFLFEMFFSQRLVLPKTGISPPEYDFNWDIDY